MFTGIIEAIGSIVLIERIDSDKRFVFNTESLDLSDVKLGDSISVNGVCLSVVELQVTGFSADVSVETLSCTTFNEFETGEKVNFEKALLLSSRLSGHMVNGHVDGKGIIQKKTADARSERFEIKFPAELGKYICKKGSICVDGVSLTINEVDEATFSVNIIPHTNEETIFSNYVEGKQVNLEVDIVARYMESLISHES
ncbi:MAG: riboflavin synthase [Gammaproteobacteria bacterium]|nr:MAG: riboflavin synthase [Gammaproteobacteria bacterium]